MTDINWDWGFFFIAVFTLILIQFIEEYKYHKKINFASFKSYTAVFWFLNLLYVLFGSIFATFIGMVLNPSSPLAAIVYAGSWEGLFHSIISSKKEVENETSFK